MLIVFDSKTGNVERFVSKLGMRNKKLYNGLVTDEPFILISYTTGFGQVPNSTVKFLEDNSDHLKAVAISGNMNWGSNFGRAGDIIAEQLSVPLILKFELSGKQNDIKKFKQEVIRIDQSIT